MEVSTITDWWFFLISTFVHLNLLQISQFSICSKTNSWCAILKNQRFPCLNFLSCLIILNSLTTLKTMINPRLSSVKCFPQSVKKKKSHQQLRHLYKWAWLFLWFVNAHLICTYSTANTYLCLYFLFSGKSQSSEVEGSFAFFFSA